VVINKIIDYKIFVVIKIIKPMQTKVFFCLPFQGFLKVYLYLHGFYFGATFPMALFRCHFSNGTFSVPLFQWHFFGATFSGPNNRNFIITGQKPMQTKINF
jgi:hypothetical protein